MPQLTAVHRTNCSALRKAVVAAYRESYRPAVPAPVLGAEHATFLPADEASFNSAVWPTKLPTDFTAIVAPIYFAHCATKLPTIGFAERTAQQDAIQSAIGITDSATFHTANNAAQQ
jgi:hypothetical protein